MLKKAIYAGLIISLLLAGCGPFVEPGSDYEPKEVFQHLIESPFPDSILLLQGDAQTWQGYTAWLRFKASPSYIESLINSGFISVEWQKISWRFELPDDLEEKFEPPWDPASLQNKKCYLKKDIKNDWTHAGEHYLVIDVDNSIVYFYGVGS